MKYVPLDKRSKKEQRECDKSQRVAVTGMNTGTRDMATDKLMSRAKRKQMDRKEQAEACS